MPKFLTVSPSEDSEMNDDQFTIQMDSMAYGGSGVGRREDGKVIFIPMVLPGETVKAVITRDYKSYAVAELKEVISASPSRITAPCVHFAACGGCDWQHIAYGEQVKLKQEILKAQFKSKSFEIDKEMKEPALSPEEYAYRCHAFLQSSYKDQFETGFFRKQSNSIVPIDRCLVLNIPVQEAMHKATEFIRENRLPNIVALEIHAPQERAIMRIHTDVSPSKAVLDALEVMQRSLHLEGLSVFPVHVPGKERNFGQRSCSYVLSILGRKVILESVMGGFIQANLNVNKQLIEHVAECVKGSGRILDLYSGSGNFGIPLSFHVQEVLAVEHDERLVKSGADLAQKNGSSNIRFLNEKVSRALKWLVQEGTTFDSVILDPPREGAKEAVFGISRMKVSKVAYVSCNPSTLARDCALLAKAGFKIKSIKLFDMFPQTFHIESVTVLER